MHSQLFAVGRVLTENLSIFCGFKASNLKSGAVDQHTGINTAFCSHNTGD